MRNDDAERAAFALRLAHQMLLALVQSGAIRKQDAYEMVTHCFQQGGAFANDIAREMRNSLDPI